MTATTGCLCDGHGINPNHGGPCCGVAGGLCIACRPRDWTHPRNWTPAWRVR
jgi:hypothetical protein